MDLQEALAEIEKLQKTLAHRGPRACVTGLVTDATNSRIALIKHKHRGKWELAGGKIGDEGHEGETWQEALLREMREELGVEVTVADGPPIEVLNGPAVAGANYRSVVLVVRAVVEGDLTPGDDVVAARMFERSEIPWDDLSDLASKEIISLWANEEVLESMGPHSRLNVHAYLWRKESNRNAALTLENKKLRERLSKFETDPVEQIRTHLGLGPDDEDVETIERVREMKRKSAVYDKLVTHHEETFSQLVAQMTADLPEGSITFTLDKEARARATSGMAIYEKMTAAGQLLVVSDTLSYVSLGLHTDEVTDDSGEGDLPEEFYIASKVKHAPRWLDLRAHGVPINSTWIDEAGEGESSDYADLWMRCIQEASDADALIVYVEPGEHLKGALVEVGVALASGKEVRVVGELPSKSLVHHPLVRQFKTLDDALGAGRLRTARGAMSFSNMQNKTKEYLYERWQHAARREKKWLDVLCESVTAAGFDRKTGRHSFLAQLRALRAKADRTPPYMIEVVGKTCECGADIPEHAPARTTGFTCDCGVKFYLAPATWERTPKATHNVDPVTDAEIHETLHHDRNEEEWKQREEETSPYTAGKCGDMYNTLTVDTRPKGEVEPTPVATFVDDHSAEAAVFFRFIAPKLARDLVQTRRDHAFLKGREETIVDAVRPSDGGQYRADIVSAIHRLRNERDALLGAAKTLCNLFAGEPHEELAEVKQLRKIVYEAVVLPSLGVDTPWPLVDVLTKLIEATDLLFDRYDYDALGWETIHHARSAARGFVEQLRGAFAPKDGV